MKPVFVLIGLFLLFSCTEKMVESEPLEETTGLYFPPINRNEWETIDNQTLGWDEEEVGELLSFLEDNGTRAFVILIDGKIVLEEYWGTELLSSSPFDANSNWYWASAGKTLTALLTGIAQENGYLSIDDQTSKYLGKNWTSASLEQEDQILIRHQLTMTTGLDYKVDDVYCTDPECLEYRKDAGTQWYYHNAPYTLLEEVISNAVGSSYNDFTDDAIERKIGMNGEWIKSGYNNIYFSNARSAARFGLLMLNNGNWGSEEVLADKNYISDMTTPSQELNPSYGYLTWLNGSDKIIFPGLGISFNKSLSDSAPSDLYAAMGKNGQFINVIPSKNMVVVRMGEAPENSLVPTKFHDEMWDKINNMID